MKNIVVIGAGNVTSCIASKLKEVETQVYQSAFEEVIEYKNPYAFLNEKQPASKSQLKKCAKGLHEFIASAPVKVSDNLQKTPWNCIHCGISKDNR
jgi:hypothetical protein